MNKVDYTIIGAGVVGLAIAAELSRSDWTGLLIERNKTFGEETSSRNSEVIHAGIYYPQNSLKAELCVQGKSKLYKYCKENNIPHKKVGKLIVATCEEEEETLKEIYSKAVANQVNDLSWMERKEVGQLEPNVKATKALFSPSTGIIDTHTLMRSLLRTAENRGLYFIPETEVIKIDPQVDGFLIQSRERSGDFTYHSKIVVNAAGLSAQSVASHIQGLDPSSIPKLHLCKGNYFKLSGKPPFKHLIYPVPEKNGAGLGIHATLDLQGQVRFGPDAEYVDNIDYQPNIDNLPKYYQAIRRYFPTLQNNSLQADYAGIRPKIQGPGETVKDFVIQTEIEHNMRGLIQLFGIESPGLTSCIAIADRVAHLVQKSNNFRSS